MPQLLPFLEELGFEFHLDLEGELQIHVPTDVTVAGVYELVKVRSEAIATEVKWRAKRQLRQCMGGPCNGQRHGKHSGHILFHMERGRWAVYVIAQDGRAFYCGEETSKQKARRRAYANMDQWGWHALPHTTPTEGD